jgi:predicted ATPase/DNA-binding winged helix-turn-helix (wHTH) protein
MPPVRSLQVGAGSPRQTSSTSDMLRSTVNANLNEVPAHAGYETLTFGPFHLDPVQHLLARNGEPVAIGSRALDLLVALTERAGQTLGKRELIDYVWPNVVIEDGTLRVQIATLRKVLGARPGGARYVENVTGRGYRFAAPVIRLPAQPSVVMTRPPATAPLASSKMMPTHRITTLPMPLTRIVGRARVIELLAARIPRQRFVTIIGPGGGGKTTVAVGVAAELAPTYADGVCFVDLASISEPRRIAQVLAASLGLPVLAADPLAGALKFLAERALLLVLDNCEHVIETAAQLAEAVLRAAPRVDLIATSREPLQAQSEFVHRLAPLETPVAPAALTRSQALAFPAIQLFVERAVASADTFELAEDEAPLVAQICQRLGGNPLAIEVAAARVGQLGVAGLAESLKSGLELALNGRRTAAPRHRSLRATLDWSHDLLSDPERAILRRLAVFVGVFDMQTATEVVADDALSTAAVFEGITSLVLKSLVVADTSGETALYRLLDTPHAYALEKLRDAGELALMRQRHAKMWCTTGAAQIQAYIQRGADWLALFGRRIDDLRAALAWCFSPHAPLCVGTQLTLSLLYFEFILAGEYGGYQPREPAAADSRSAATAALLGELDEILGDLLTRTVSPVQDLTVAQRLGASGYNLTAGLWSLWIERLTARDYRVAFRISDRFRDRTIPKNDDTMALRDQMLTVAHHYAGYHSLARHHAERVLHRSQKDTSVAVTEPALLCHTRCMLARILWVQGFPDQALRETRESVAEALRSEKPYVICPALLGATAVLLWCGLSGEAATCATLLRNSSTAHSIEYYRLWANCADGITAAYNGEITVESPLRLSPDPLSGSQYFDILGTISANLVSVAAIARAHEGRTGWCTAEILRVNAMRKLTERGPAAADQVESELQTSLEIARRHGALSWQLRTAMSLAGLWRTRNHIAPALELLSDVHSRFTEGFQTRDLSKARQLLDELNRS